jgi:hypothetical protein
VPLPKNVMSGIFKPAPPSYFLMRRSQDGYISATGMFKATFPWAEVAEEEAERKYIKSLPTTSTDETAGNVWIPPAHALQLAEEYQITTWIKALLDNKPVDVNPGKDTDGIPKAISPPPKFMQEGTLDVSKLPAPNFAMAQEALAAPTQSRGRLRRSASPTKIASPKKALATPRKSKTAKAGLSESVTSVPHRDLQWTHVAGSETASSGALESTSMAPTPEPSSTEESQVLLDVDEGVTVNGKVDEGVKVNGKVDDGATVNGKVDDGVTVNGKMDEGVTVNGKVDEEVTVNGNVDEGVMVNGNVDEGVTVNGNVETTHTHVEFEMSASVPGVHLPEDTKTMIAKAKEMVEAVVRAESEAGPSNPKKSKRKADAIEPEAGTEANGEVPTEAGQAVKKVKIESELRKERVKTRALIGISATLAIG